MKLALVPTALTTEAPAPVEPAGVWMTAAEISAAALPGLPRVPKKVKERANNENWVSRVDASGAPLARVRRSVGGGIEYHISLLPASARAKLDRLAREVPSVGPSRVREGSLWSWFDRQSAKTKDKAGVKLAALNDVVRLEAQGCTRVMAVTAVAQEREIGASTIWAWFDLVKGVAPEDWLPHLAPRHSGGGKEMAVDPELWLQLISDYLRPERPSWASCYNRLVELWAAPRGIEVPISRTLWRKFEREVDPLVAAKRRHGREALERTQAPQIRDVSGLHAMELVNIDGHLWDVYVRWPNGEVIRPVMVAIQDVYSGKLLAWRLDETENKVVTRLAFADLFRDYGIPKGCLLDNGRAFASKEITGGAKTRFRFKIKPDEPTGLLPALGVNPVWATPYHGQAKPIERMFRNFCGDVAKHPEFSGAWAGNNPLNKPENYGKAAVPYDVFVATLKQFFKVYNARQGRRTQMAAGRSFDDAFNESYAVAPIGKATPEQLRLALLTALNDVRTDKNNGAIMVHGNRYWFPPMSHHAGEKVVVRFDPDNLHSEIHVYTRDGRFLHTVPCMGPEGFRDVDAAQVLARRRAQHRRTVRDQEKALGLLTAAELAAIYRQDSDDAADGTPEPSVIRPVRFRGNAAPALQPALNPLSEAAEAPRTPSVMDQIGRLRLVE